MALPKKLYKTTVVIWSTFDPTDKYELDELGREAMEGQFYCSSQEAECITDMDEFPETEFFDLDGGEEFGDDDEIEGPPSSTRSDKDD